MKTRFSVALAAVAVGSSMLCFAGGAQSSTVNFASTVSFTESLPDLAFASSGLNTTLTVGTPYTITNFISVTAATGSWADVGSLIANFLFTIPTPTGTTTDGGQVAGAQVNGSRANGTLSIIWPNQPVEFNFADGTKLDVTLGNLAVNCSGNNCLDGSEPYYMSATFLALNGPGAAPGPGETPLPAAFWLFGTVAAGWAGMKKFASRRPVAFAAA